MFSRVYFEISGRCNARCHWCQTGYKNKQGVRQGGVVDPGDFSRSLDYMQKNNIIGPRTVISLYTWGEPFLHPQFKDIVKILNDRDIYWSLSTNGSRPVFFQKKNELRNLVQVMFSMCGFSQASYDRIHGFNFEKIRRNLLDLTKNFEACGFRARPMIAFHVYQFNFGELPLVMEFASQNRMQLLPSYAFIADLERFKQYAKSQLSYMELKRAAEELFLFYTETNRNKIPPGHVCPQYLKLTINESCDVITCCSDSTVIGKIWDFKGPEINPIRMNSEACNACKEVGGDYQCPPVIESVIRSRAA